MAGLGRRTGLVVRLREILTAAAGIEARRHDGRTARRTSALRLMGGQDKEPGIEGDSEKDISAEAAMVGSSGIHSHTLPSAFGNGI